MSKAIDFQTVELHDHPDYVGVFVLPKEPGDIERSGRGFVVKRGGVEEFMRRAREAEDEVLEEFRK